MGAPRWVLHVDLDGFIAAVERLRRPELVGKPVVVGGTGDPTQRGVVATASYEARAFGVRSGMPLRTAARRCPHAVFLPTDPPAYEAVSVQVMETLRTFPAVVEVVGWDEAFLDVAVADPEDLAQRIQHAVLARTALTCSVGIGDNKLRAKLATGFAKPGGVFRLTEATWWPVMGRRPTHALWGVGDKTARKLAALGIRTVADLAASDVGELARRFGPTMGPWLRRLARGEDRTPVAAGPYVAKSRSRETTFQRNLTDWDAVRAEVAALARRVAQDVVVEGRPAVRVGVKVRWAPFETRTRSVGLPTPSSEAAVIEAAALTALEGFEPGREVRLVGVRAELDRAGP
ncbi:DNA polymerase IV [Thermasporomyces composti]|uniref:DNA polymerase IV n=1 Tax=Thermasporomyces composti TaxID=696763 RepID=A0A3D9V0N0_THECX|nr:DNA polymerase IV [Thermasporomyces composti]REF35039.1 DNA polymerase-4 [Thermasporomyces composti]